MADVVSLLPVLELVEDFEEINDIMDDDDDIVVFSAVSCFMRRNLTRISGYFEQTVPRYLPDEFRQHFRMTRETFGCTRCDRNLSHLYMYAYFRTTYQNSRSHVSINQSSYLQEAGTTRTETFDQD